MTKLPILASAGESSIFPFTHFFQLLRRVAIPTLLIIATLSASDLLLGTELAEAKFADNPLFYSILIVVALAAFLNVYVGTMQVALQLPEGSSWFEFDGSEIRVALYYLLWGGVLLGVVLLISGFGSLFPSVGSEGDAQETGPKLGAGGGLLVIMLIAFAFPFTVWVGVRLVPMPAYIVATKSLNLKEGWTVGRGNSLRVLGASIVQGLLLAIFIQLPSLGLSTMSEIEGWRGDAVAGIASAAELYFIFATVAFYALVYKGLTSQNEEETVQPGATQNIESNHSAA